MAMFPYFPKCATGGCAKRVLQLGMVCAECRAAEQTSAELDRWNWADWPVLPKEPA